MSIQVNSEELDPLDICGVTAGLLLAVGTLREIVSHQPANDRAKANLAEAEEKLRRHIQTCEKCRKALDDPQEEEA